MPVLIVMAGLDPAIHGPTAIDVGVVGDVDHQDKPGDDDYG